MNNHIDMYNNFDINVHKRTKMVNETIENTYNKGKRVPNVALMCKSER